MAKSVFISYSRLDRDHCKQLKANLERQGLAVSVDEVGIDPGDDLRGRISSLLASSDITICLVSKNSLRSLWVIWEVKRSVESGPGERFLPVYLDKEFLRSEVVDEIQGEVDLELDRLDAAIKSRMAARQKFDDLNALWNDLQSFRTELSSVVVELRKLCVVDLTPPSYEQGFLLVYKRITGHSELAAPILIHDSLDNTSYSERKRQIENAVADNDLLQAATRTMDLLRQFFKQNAEANRTAVRLSGQIRFLMSAYETEKKKGITVEFLSFYEPKVYEYAEQLLQLIPPELELAA